MNLLHAFTYEALNDTQFAHKDPANNTVLLIRTESSGVFSANGIKKKPGAQVVKFRRGAAESTSLYNPYSYRGEQVTEQKVPISDILGTYWFDRSGGSGSQTFFCGEHENEFVAFLGDKEMRWTGHYSNYFQDVPEAKTPEYTTWKTP